jgi:hypothetical protein
MRPCAWCHAFRFVRRHFGVTCDGRHHVMRDVTAVTIVLHHPKMARQREPAGFDFWGQSNGPQLPAPLGAVSFPKRKARLLAGRFANTPNVMKREHLRSE